MKTYRITPDSEGKTREQGTYEGLRVIFTLTPKGWVWWVNGYDRILSSEKPQKRLPTARKEACAVLREHVKEYRAARRAKRYQVEADKMAKIAMDRFKEREEERKQVDIFDQAESPSVDEQCAAIENFEADEEEPLTVDEEVAILAGDDTEEFTDDLEPQRAYYNNHPDCVRELIREDPNQRLLTRDGVRCAWCAETIVPQATTSPEPKEPCEHSMLDHRDICNECGEHVPNCQKCGRPGPECELCPDESPMIDADQILLGRTTPRPTTEERYYDLINPAFDFNNNKGE